MVFDSPGVQCHFCLSSSLPSYTKHPLARWRRRIASMPPRPPESLPPLHELLPPPSLSICVHLSCTGGNRSKVKCYSFPTAAGLSNSKNHHAGHPLGIKWFHINELYTSHLLRTPSAILFTLPTRTTSRIKPPPPILAAVASMRTAMAASRCWLAP
jgi:hypothetical protein